MLWRGWPKILIQVILDYAAVLASEEKGVKPETYRELASSLAERLRLSELRGFLEGLAGFRNLLVHMYARLDKRLEEEAFKDMEAKIPRLLGEMRMAVRGDPCLEDVAKPLRELGRELGLHYIIVFGSLARRGCGRDVDVAVKLGRRPCSLLEVGRLQAALEDKLGAKVDLVVLDIEVPINAG